MKTAVVFYSLDGNCAFTAKQIKKHLNADLLQLQTKDEKKRSFIGKIFWGGGMVFLRKKPPLKPYVFDPSSYDLIILGAPVWANTIAPPVETFLRDTPITGKKIALFVNYGGSKGNSFKRFKTLLAGNNIVAELELKTAVKNCEDVMPQIEKWAKGLDNL